MTATIIYHPAVFGAVENFVPMWREGADAINNHFRQEDGRDYFPVRLLEAKLDGDRVALQFEEIAYGEVGRALVVLAHLQTLESPPCDLQRIKWMSDLLTLAVTPEHPKAGS